MSVIDGDLVQRFPSRQLQKGKKLHGLRVIGGSAAGESAAHVIPEITTDAKQEQEWPSIERGGRKPLQTLSSNETGGTPCISRVVATMPNATQYK